MSSSNRSDPAFRRKPKAPSARREPKGRAPPSQRTADGRSVFFATCPRGIEAALAVELLALDAQNVQATDGGASFEGKTDLAYKVNLWSRIASRVLWQVGSCRYRNQQDIFDAALKLQWQGWFGVDCTIRVNVTAIHSPLTSIDFITLKIKDAVCDRFRMESGKRPSVNTAAPDVRIHAFLTSDTCTFYLDTSGEALFKRGYRADALEAPLRENLAAGMLALAGWRPEFALLDPFCGSGTILIEAAMIACDIAPGLHREFGFRRLSWFDVDVWIALRAAAVERAESGRKSASARLFGSDVSADALNAADAHIAAVGVERLISLQRADARQLGAPAAVGIIITNPPYGVRLGADVDLRALYAEFANNLKRHFAGWNAWLLCGELALVKAMRLAPSRKVPLYNGAIECRLVEYRMVSGSNRKQSSEDAPVDGKMQASD